MPILIFNEVLMRPLVGVMLPRLLRNRMTAKVPLRLAIAIRAFQPMVLTQASMRSLDMLAMWSLAGKPRLSSFSQNT